MEIFEKLAWFPDEIDDLNFESEIFHENTTINISNAEKYGRYIEQISSNPVVSREWEGHIRTRPGAPNISLPKPKNISTSLTECMRNRKSADKYAKGAIHLDDLSTLLWHAMGSTDSAAIPPRYTNPSAGALYSCSAYCISLSVDGLEEGVFHFDPNYHRLECLRRGVHREFCKKSIFSQGIAEKASIFFIITFDLERALLKYADRGYRYALFECGHIAQNFLITAAALDLACTPFGGFHDSDITEFLKLPKREHPAYVLSAGRVPK